MTENKEVIRDFHGRTLGTITTDTLGNKIARDFYGRTVGRYDVSCNVTRDFYGRIVSRGDRVASLIPTSK
jgi:hypothetical protein